MVLQLVVDGDSIFDVVTARSVSIIVHDSAICSGREFISAHSFETFVWTAFSTTRDILIEAAGCIVSVCSGKHILGLNTWDEASVARETLITDLVGWAIDPGLGVFTFVANHKFVLVEFLLVVDAG